ncbi:hypothetical protein BY996DRAFT_6473426 [Phakopsora pachyrhizi]|uniref:Homeobox domain-containing protein n=1 Tax=Phakopsora pachyrhizi TaxID=170000 RepID=A0AAV0BAI3_PHAPC|nr:hypothetical protein BY996DRAFT_6473426 [Phakopsora pachyrhizi]CAH7684164.1 hypothetical protein PPACK8108_LOCUS18212 [Phakopsora pachyrhizi]
MPRPQKKASGHLTTEDYFIIFMLLSKPLNFTEVNQKSKSGLNISSKQMKEWFKNYKAKYVKAKKMSDSTGFGDITPPSVAETRKKSTETITMEVFVGFCCVLRRKEWPHWKEGQKLGGGAQQGQSGWSKTTGARDFFKEAPDLEEVVSFGPTLPTHFHVDNSGLLEKIKHFGSNSKTKYLDMKMKSLRQYYKANKIKITPVPTEVMIADALTKSSSNQSLLRLLSRCLKTFSP